MQQRIRESRGALGTPFDGYAELWWDSIEDMTAARETEAGLAALRSLLADEGRFVDLERSQFWYAIERLMIPG